MQQYGRENATGILSLSESGMLPASASHFSPILKKKMLHSSNPTKAAVCGTKHTALWTYNIPEQTQRCEHIVAVNKCSPS